MDGRDACDIFSSATRIRENRMRRWMCRMASAIIHGLALTVAVLACGSLPVDRNAQSKIAYVFIPPPETAKHLRVTAEGYGIGAVNLEGNQGAKLDLKGVRLAIEQDPDYQMVESALRRYDGAIGLAFPSEPAFVTYAFVAPNWSRTQGELLSVDSFFTVIIEQPGRWRLFQNLRAQRGLEGDFLVYALFPPEFIARLHKSIRQAAAMQIQEGRVTEARIAFSITAPEGFEIVAVSVEAGARRTTI
jgi:hypothetical protein